MIILFDHGLRKQKQKPLQNRVQRTRDDFKELSGKLNRYKLKSQEQIDAACAAILRKNKTESFFTYTVINNPVATYKNSKRGRPAANAEKIANRDRGLDGFMPNRKDVRNPRSEFMLKVFEDIVQGVIQLPDGKNDGFVSDLNDHQKDILSILNVPLYYYDYQHLTDSS